MPELKCRNCSETLYSDFCHSCGQRLMKKRFSLRIILFDLANSLTNLEVGFIKTFFDFLRRPGQMTDNYLNGATRNYMKPFRYTFIWATIATVILIYSGVYDLQQESVLEFMTSNGFQHEDNVASSAQNEIQALSKKFMSFLMLAAIPFNAFGTWIMFQASKLNYQGERVNYRYADHLIINTHLHHRNSCCYWNNCNTVLRSLSAVCYLVHCFWINHQPDFFILYLSQGV